MKVILKAIHESGRIVAFELCGVPFLKWLQSKLGVGWIVEARRKFQELIARASEADLDRVAGDVWIKCDGGQFELLQGPKLKEGGK